MGSACRFIELDEASAFARVRAGAGPVLICVTPPGSGAYEDIDRALEGLARRYPDRIFYGYLDGGKAPVFVRDFGVQYVPILLLVHRGRVLSRLVGVHCVDPLVPALRFLIERSAAEA